MSNRTYAVQQAKCWNSNKVGTIAQNATSCMGITLQSYVNSQSRNIDLVCRF